MPLFYHDKVNASIALPSGYSSKIKIVGQADKEAGLWDFLSSIGQLNKTEERSTSLHSTKSHSIASVSVTNRTVYIMDVPQGLVKHTKKKR